MCTVIVRAPKLLTKIVRLISSVHLCDTCLFVYLFIYITLIINAYSSGRCANVCFGTDRPWRESPE